jgi:hypothetical protein
MTQLVFTEQVTVNMINKKLLPVKLHFFFFYAGEVFSFINISTICFGSAGSDIPSTASVWKRTRDIVSCHGNRYRNSPLCLFSSKTSLRCAGRHVQKVQEMYIYYTGGNPGVILCCDIFHTPKAPVEVNL